MLTLTKFANTAIANTDQNIPVEVIEKFMKMKPIDVLSGEDPGLDAALYEGSKSNNLATLASFIMNYGIYSFPNKETLKKSLQAIHYKVYCSALDKTQPNYDHNSVMEFFTASDFAIAFWIYENNYLDWQNKLKNPALRYKSKTKWTSNRKQPPMEDQDDTDPGVIEYHRCLNWSKELMKLKGSEEYSLLQRQCNKKALELGFLKEWGKEGGFSGVTKEAEVVEQEVPVFELDSYESIPFVAV